MRNVTSKCPSQKVYRRDPILVLLAKQGERAVDPSIKRIDGFRPRVKVPCLLALASLLLLLHLCQTVLCLGIDQQILMLRLQLTKIAQMQQMLCRQGPNSIFKLELGGQRVPVSVQLAEDTF